MPNWLDLLYECKSTGSGHDVVRRQYLQKLHQHTGRNVIIYYSGFLQKTDQVRQNVSGFDVNDGDKNGFMATIHDIDRKLGLDLVLHTPGGSMAATESLVDYLRSMFGRDIRAIVPQLAMSAGTMIALACKNIVMGKHSSLGPIDPQIGGVAAHGIIEEMARAVDAVTRNQAVAPLYQVLLSKYTPTLIGEAEKAISWSTELVREWLLTGMFHEDNASEEKISKVLGELGDHALTKSHARHISAQKAKEIGLNVIQLEDNAELQDLVLSVHHACVHTFYSTPAVKLIENHKGVAYIEQRQVQMVAV